MDRKAEFKRLDEIIEDCWLNLQVLERAISRMQSEATEARARLARTTRFHRTRENGVLVKCTRHAAHRDRSHPLSLRLHRRKHLDRICNVAKTENADLIITATDGRTGLSHLLIGSTAELTVRYAPCAVIVVPSHREVRARHLAK